MTDVVQLHLVELPEEPRLTDRQQMAYDAIAAAGRDGLHHDEVGALDHQRRGKHDAGERCAFCGRDGKALGHELRAKGLVTLRRRSPAAAWTVAGKLQAPGPTVADNVYGVFPEGFMPTVACVARVPLAARSIAA